MKKLVFFLFSVVILFNLSCTPDKCCMPPQPSAHMMADKNGVTWSSFDVAGKRSSVDSLTIYAISGENIPGAFVKDDSLNVKIFYSANGSYPLHSNQAFYATYTNGVT